MSEDKMFLEPWMVKVAEAVGQDLSPELISALSLAYKEGEDAGREAGRKDGYSEGYDDGYATGCLEES